MRRKVDATQGSIVKLLLSYTIPLIFTTLVQHFFNIVDKAVLGNMADINAVASVSATGTITNLMLNCFVGLTSGTSIILARYVGQRNEEKIRRTVDTSLVMGVVFGLIVAVVGVIFSPLFLTLTDCPEECYDGAVLYLRMIISAAPFTLLYNFGAAVLRTLGDTKRPLKYIIIAGLSNVVLNIILCFVLEQKVAAVAIATIASKVISGLLVFRRLCKLDTSARVSLKSMKPGFEACINIVRFGVPAALSNLVTPLSNLQIVSAVNSFGVDSVAGNSAAASMLSIASAFAGGFSIAATAFMGQNLGANNKERVKKSFWCCLLCSFVCAGSVGYLLYLSRELWLGLILGAGSTAAIEYGSIRMFYTCQFAFMTAISNVLLHALQAFGYPFFGSVSSVLFTLGFRVIWMQLIYPTNPTYEMIMVCFTVTWAMSMIFYIITTSIVFARYNRGVYKKI